MRVRQSLKRARSRFGVEPLSNTNVGSGPLAFAVWPPAGSPVSLRTWWREINARTLLNADPPAFPEDAARGHGATVIVLPGFCAPDLSTIRLRNFLRRQGFAAQPWDCGTNLGPTRTILTSLERLLGEAADRQGSPVALVGVSLGGTIAREIAKRRSECVDRIVTIASPIKLPVATPLAPLAKFASLVWHGDAREALARVAEPPPVPVTAIVNPKDGIVDWRACVPDPAPNVEVIAIEGAHTTMASNPNVQRVIAARLALST
jgi:alpha-beta hydrolase superfamily lysophospholipase